MVSDFGSNLPYNFDPDARSDKESKDENGANHLKVDTLECTRARSLWPVLPMSPLQAKTSGIFCLILIYKNSNKEKCRNATLSLYKSYIMLKIHKTHFSEEWVFKPVCHSSKLFGYVF